MRVKDKDGKTRSRFIKIRIEWWQEALPPGLEKPTRHIHQPRYMIRPQNKVPFYYVMWYGAKTRFWPAAGRLFFRFRLTMMISYSDHFVGK